jgi:hypothetical protein
MWLQLMWLQCEVVRGPIGLVWLGTCRQSGLLFWGAFLRSERPRGPGKALQKVGGCAPHLFEGLPGPPGPAIPQKRTAKNLARLSSGITQNSCGCNSRLSEVRSGSSGAGLETGSKSTPTDPTGPRTTSNCSHMSCSHIHRDRRVIDSRYYPGRRP